MTDSQQAVQIRRQAIKLYESGNYNVSQICPILGRSRTWFYKWMGRFRVLGPEGLSNQTRRLCPANRTSLDVEGEALTAAEKFPSYGPQRIAFLLQQMNIPIGKTAVYGVLKRYGLNRKQDRWEWVRKLNGEIVRLSDLDTDRQRSKKRHIQADDPGELICVDLFYVGCIKGIGRIYQMTACDAATSFAWARLYTDKSARSALDFLAHILKNAHGARVRSILTDNGKEFTTHWKSKNHPFERVLKTRGIRHRYTKVQHPWTNGFVERLNRTILEEFYQVVLRKKRYDTVKELQTDLDQFIFVYNFNRPHQGYKLKGRVPAERFIQQLKAA